MQALFIILLEIFIDKGNDIGRLNLNSLHTNTLLKRHESAISKIVDW